MAGKVTFTNPLETAGFHVKWVNRIPEVDTNVERDEAVARLMPHHIQAAIELGGTTETFWLAEQIHGNLVVPVRGKSSGQPVKKSDGLATNDPSVVIGIHVADCGAVYIGDPIKKAVSVIHSGRVGTEKNIVGAGIDLMVEEYGSTPSDLIVVLAPCIRPPAYEVDFAATIRHQVLEKGVRKENYNDCGICTTSDLNTYYSYRAEKGKTGRMLALIAL